MLFKKLLKDIKQNKGQFTAIFLIIFLGCFVFSGLNATWYGMQKQGDEYYKRTNLADFWLSGRNITRDSEKKVARIPSVEATERRLTFRVGDNQDRKATVELNYLEKNNISKNIVSTGEPFNLQKRGIWLDFEYAKAHNLKVGDNFAFNSDSAIQKIKILGLISNPEYVYPISSTAQLLPDHKDFGYGFLSYSQYFGDKKSPVPLNQLLVKTDSKARHTNFKSQLNRIVKRDDISYIKSREDTVSYSMLQDKIDQFHVLSVIFPTLFFIVAILVILTTMMRLLKNQRIQIGTLQALGFKRKKLLKHYLLYGIIISLPASIVGYLLGPIVLPPFIYKTLSMYTLPVWKASQPAYDILIIFISVLASVIAVYFSCRSILNEKPVDCLKVKLEITTAPWFERLKFWKKISFRTKWNLMDCYKNKTRTFTIIISVAGSMALILTALGLKDSLNDIIGWQYGQVSKYKTKILLKPSGDLSVLESKFDTEPIQEQLVEVKTKRNRILKNLTIYDNVSPKMTQLTDERKHRYLLPDNGLSISYRLAEKENLKNGERIEWRLISDKKWHSSKIEGIYRVPINQGISATKAFFGKEGYKFTPTTLLSPKQIDETDDKMVQQLVSVDSEKKNINKMIESMSKLVSLLIIAAVLLMIVVLYNLGKLSFVEREREIETLKVLGFKDKMLRKMFKRELTVLTVIGIIIGIPFAYLLLAQILKMMGSSTDMVLIFNLKTLLMAMFGTLVTGLIINTIQALQINRADLVEALKSIE